MTTTSSHPSGATRDATRRAKGAATAQFLPEIQGLRAIAVGLVLLYHVSESKLPRAGFVGVDVFFVISGFLITDHLLREVARTGGIGLPRFYARRARRLLPAALTVLLFTLVVTLLWVPQTLWSEFSRQIIASVLYVENWALAVNATDYAAAAPDTSPVQHFWSLGVEEQFYVFWPLLILLGARVARGAAGWRRHTAAALLGVVVLVSFALSVWQTGRDAGLAYFVTQTRIWELGVGGLLCYAVRWTWVMGRAARGAAGWLGLLLIAAAAFGIRDTTSFPGWEAALPVLGAVLVIAAGHDAGRLSPSPALRLRPMQWLGDISYSLYLWHWPILLLAPYVLGHGLDGLEKLAVIPASLLAAAVSKTFIEDRLRANRPRPEATARVASGRAALAGIVSASVVICIVAAALDNRAQTHERKAREELAAILVDPPPCFGAAALPSGRAACPARTSGKVYPDPLIAGTELDGANRGCLIAGPDRVPRACVHGSSSPVKDIALVGDSHAQQWLVPLLKVAAQRNWRVTTYLKSGCPLTTVTPVSQRTFGSACPDWNKAVAAILLRRRFAAVLVSGFTGLKYPPAGSEGSVEAGARGMATAWRPLVRAGIPIIALRDNPLPTAGGVPDTPSCVADAADFTTCGTRESQSLRPDPQTLAARAVPGVGQVDLTSSFCARSFCPAVIGDVIVYEVAGHVTATYARTLAPALAARLRPLVD